MILFPSESECFSLSSETFADQIISSHNFSPVRILHAHYFPCRSHLLSGKKKDVWLLLQAVFSLIVWIWVTLLQILNTSWMKKYMLPKRHSTQYTWCFYLQALLATTLTSFWIQMYGSWLVNPDCMIVLTCATARGVNIANKNPSSREEKNNWILPQNPQSPQDTSQLFLFLQYVPILPTCFLLVHTTRAHEFAGQSSPRWSLDRVK